MLYSSNQSLVQEKGGSLAVNEALLLKLDGDSGAGQNNVLLPALKNLTPVQFEACFEFIQTECTQFCWYFSDAIEFLSICLEKSSDLLFQKLESSELKKNFINTNNDHEDEKYHFPALLTLFSDYLSEDRTADRILDFLFKNFDFANDPTDFISSMIGYDKLQDRVEETPEVFKLAFLRAVQSMIENAEMEADPIDIGQTSRFYLEGALGVFHPNQQEELVDLQEEEFADWQEELDSTRNRSFRQG